MSFVMNMPHDNIDMRRIDPPLRKLVAALNAAGWCRTVGCCAGAACHRKGEGNHFYVLMEVDGAEGIRKLQDWLSLHHKIGYEACHEKHQFENMELLRAELHTSNFLNREPNGGWIRFQIGIYNHRSSVTRQSVSDCISVMEMALEALPLLKLELERLATLPPPQPTLGDSPSSWASPGR